MDKLKKINRILFFIIAIFLLFNFGSSFLIPLIFGVFFASLMTPFAELLEKLKIPRILSALLSTLVIFIVVGSILYLMLHQLTLFLSDISKIRTELQSLIETAQSQITQWTNLSLEDQKKIWQERSGQILTTLESHLTNFLGNLANTLLDFLIVLVYVFLFVYYRKKFSDFVMMYTPEKKRVKTGNILKKISKVVYHYLWGRAKVMALLGVMYYITFLIFDIPYAVLLTLFGALITIIPYVGPFVSGILPIFFAVIYLDDVGTIILFTAIIVTIQLVESYVFEPLVIGSEVKLNPLMVIIAIILGGMFWGLAGMILFVPMFAMFKIVAQNTQGLEPIGMLLGTSKERMEESEEK
ncbi:MAG: AI-2E family transporter [Bacteroidetes bacterium]|nr:MAG: AI-2E family transporter [Bacteroidota bacterium]